MEQPGGHAEEQQRKTAPPGAVALDDADYSQDLRRAYHKLQRAVFRITVYHLVALVFNRALACRIIHAVTPYFRNTYRQ